jgi:hypothetical protein
MGGEYEVRSLLMRCCALSYVNTNIPGDVHDHVVIIYGIDIVDYLYGLCCNQ